MSTQDLTQERLVMQSVVSQAMNIAQRRFRTQFVTTLKASHGDLVTDVDLECERIMKQTLMSAFPDHAIFVEETDNHLTTSKWRWIIDPLDGTNNYAYGLPVWGVSAALALGTEPVLACVADGPNGSIAIAQSGMGITLDTQPFSVPAKTSPHFSAAFWVGYGVDRTTTPVQEILAVLSKSSRRVFENWAPTIDVHLFLRGAIDVIVGYKCSGTELPAVLLVLKEAGARVCSVEGQDVSLYEPPPIFVAGLPEILDRVLPSLRDRLGSR
jgi:myo-inositol-1(or 4)-monophosphatase